jgi:hemoglobin
MEPTPTLYQRLGGEPGVKRLLVAFYGKVLADPELKPFFIRTSMEKLLRMQEEFFGAALDGPHHDSGRRLKEVHAGRGITVMHFHRFLQHLLDTLKEVGVGVDDMRDVARRVTAIRNDIVV